VVGLSVISSCYFVGCSISGTFRTLTAYCRNFSHRASHLFGQFLVVLSLKLIFSYFEAIVKIVLTLYLL
jgi:hypothetical protein